MQKMQIYLTYAMHCKDNQKHEAAENASRAGASCFCRYLKLNSESSAADGR